MRGGDRQVEVLGGGLHARVHHLRAHPGAALGLVVAEVAGALGGVGLDAHADAGHLGEPLAVLAAELDPVDRLLDDRAGGVEVALAALELAAQRAAAGQVLRLEREREDAGGLLQQRARGARVAAAEQQPGAGEVEVGQRRAGEAAALREVRLGGVPLPQPELDLRPAASRASARRASPAGGRPRRRSPRRGPRGCGRRGAARRRGWRPRTPRRSPGRCARATAVASSKAASPASASPSANSATPSRLRIGAQMSSAPTARAASSASCARVAHLAVAALEHQERRRGG